MTTEFQAYSSKATAIRGFDRHFSGRDAAPYIAQVDGKWGFYPDQVDTTGEIEAMAADLEKAALPDDLTAPEHQVGAPAEDDMPVLVEEGAQHVEHPIPASPVPPAEGEPETFFVKRGRSTEKGAVGKCWSLFSEHRDLRRKDAIAMAVAEGVAYYTARTQYQLWHVAQRER